MLDTKFTPPTVDQATVDHYVAKGRRIRSRAFVEMIRDLFSQPEQRPVVRATAQSS